MKAFDIDGERVKELKVIVRCGDQDLGLLMVNLGDEQPLSQFRDYQLVDESGANTGARVNLQIRRQDRTTDGSARGRGADASKPAGGFSSDRQAVAVATAKTRIEINENDRIAVSVRRVIGKL